MLPAVLLRHLIVGRSSLVKAAAAAPLSTRYALQRQSFVRALATEAIPTEPKPPRKPRTTKPKSSDTTVTKAADTVKKAAKKVAKKVVPKEVKKAKKPVVKPKPWEVRGADGKLLPLPSATKPKRTSAFLLYIQARTPELKSDPSMLRSGSTDKIDITKVTKAVGAEWKSLSQADKQPYEAQAEKAKATYDQQMVEWRNSLTTEDIKRQNAYLRDQAKKGKKSMRLRDPAKPKAPMTSFFIFLQDYRASNSGTLTEMAKNAAVEWKSMSDDQKKPYLDKAEERKASYAAAKKDYQSSST